MRNPLFEEIIKISAESSKMPLFPKRVHFSSYLGQGNW